MDGDVRRGIECSIAAGAAIIEFDVRRTADDVLVVHHGGSPEERTLASRRAADVTGPAIPRLDEVLQWIDGRAGVNLELKEPGYERDVVAAALELVAPDDLLVTSFHDAALAAVRSAEPTLCTGLIVGRRPSPAQPRRLVEDVFPFARVRDCGADVLVAAWFLGYTLLPRRASSRGVPLVLWTVNHPARLRRALADASLLGVVSDHIVPSTT